MISSIRNFVFQASQPTVTPHSTPSPNLSISSLSSLQHLGKDPTPKNIKILKISSQNQEIIQLLVKELATQSVLYLAYHGFRLTKIGAALKEEVHPYLFLLFSGFDHTYPLISVDFLFFPALLVHL